MRLSDKGDGRQTPWACGPNGQIWYANVHADIEDEVVVENAKRIVDKAVPQRRSTFFGGHYYSFVTREYLLNLLLFYYKSNGLFPTGAVCIVDEWVWNGFFWKEQGKWWPVGWFWRFKTRRADLHKPGWWVQIPSLLSVLQEEEEGEVQHG